MDLSQAKSANFRVSEEFADIQEAEIDIIVEREVIRQLAEREGQGVLTGVIGVLILISVTLHYGHFEKAWPFLLFISLQLVFGTIARKRVLKNIAEDKPLGKSQLAMEIAFMTTAAGWGALVWPIRDSFLTDPGSVLLFASAIYALFSAILVVSMHRRSLNFSVAGYSAAIMTGVATPLGNSGYIFLFAMPVLILTMLSFGHYLAAQFRASVYFGQKNVLLSDKLSAANAQLETALAVTHKLSRTDSLTGLLNRRAFMDEAEQLFGAHAGDFPCHILLVDLDHFKRINDRFGHNIGDAVLKRSAAVMQDCLHGKAIVARWGGEEFIALVHAGEGGDIVSLADELCKRFKRLSSVDWPQGVSVSASIGAAPLSTAQQMQSAIGDSDKALYEAKNAGRGCVRLGGMLQE